MYCMSFLRKVLFCLVIAILLPSVSFAAFDDVVLEAGVVTILVNGYTISVYGSSATLASITVNETSFSVALGAGSSIEIKSSDRLNFVHDADSSFVINTVCSDIESRITFASSGTPTTITVAPSGICHMTSEQSSSGGRGTSSYRRVVNQNDDVFNGSQSWWEYRILLLQLQELIRQLIASGGVPTSEMLTFLEISPDSFVREQNYEYQRDLQFGDSGDDVGFLQQFLVRYHAGSVSEQLLLVGITRYFGDLTRDALAEFQAHVGIAPASGYFGPKTRAYIASQ